MRHTDWASITRDQENVVGSRLGDAIRQRTGGALASYNFHAAKDAALAELLATAHEAQNVMGYGAKGNGSTDDTDAVSAAVTAALALDNNDEQTLGRHGIVYFPPGRTYAIDGIVVPALSTLHVIAHGATISVAGANKAILVNGTSSDRAGLIVEGGLWKGDNTAGSVGIDLTWCTTACVIRNVVLRDFGDGLVVVDTHSGSADDLRVFSCVSRGVYLNGDSGSEGVFGWQFNRPYITNNDVGMLWRGTVVDVVVNGGQIRASGTNELQIYGTTGKSCNGNRFLGVHFERAFTAPQATDACIIDIESGGTRPNGNLFYGCQWSGAYTNNVEVGQAVNTVFRDCQSETSVTNTVVTTHANALGTRVENWLRTDLGLPDLVLGHNGGVYAPAALATGENNDQNPDNSGVQTEVWRLSAHASGSSVTGITRGWQGRRLVVWNVSANDLTLVNADTSSEAENRIVSGTGADVVLGANDTATLMYDASTERWRVVAVVT